MKKLFKLFSLLAVVGTFSAAHANDHKSEAEHKEKPYKEVSTEELQKLIEENKDLVILDTRGGKYFDGTVIKGAKALATDKTDAASVAKVAPNKEATIVLYCQNVDCPASAKSAYKFKELGYNNLLKYPGGIEEWVKKGLPTEKLAKN